MMHWLNSLKDKTVSSIKNFWSGNNGISVLAVVPGRLDSKRLPRKLLLPDYYGKPIIIHTLERVAQCKYLDEVFFVTDSIFLYDKVCDYVADSFLLHNDSNKNLKKVVGSFWDGDEYNTGLDRTSDFFGEMLEEEDLEGYGYVLHVHGDEALIDPKDLDRLVESHVSNSYPMTQLVYNPYSEEMHDESVCKAFGYDDRLTGYTRKPNYDKEHPEMYKSCAGAFCFDRELFEKFYTLPVRENEKITGIEQYRVIDNDYLINWCIGKGTKNAIDTEEDYENFLKVTSQ